MLTVTTEWTLCDIEEHLIALTESMETVTPEQEKEFLQDFSLALSSAAGKRDRVARHLAHLEQQQEFAAKEISRLQKFKKERESAQARLLHDLSYDGAHALALSGAKVLHPHVLPLAEETQMTVWVRNTFKPHARGTRIGPVSKEPA